MEGMTDLLFRFSELEALMMNTCGDTLLTMKWCLQLPEHRRLTRGEEDCRSSLKMLKSFLEECANQVLSMELGKVKSGELLK